MDYYLIGLIQASRATLCVLFLDPSTQALAPLKRNGG